MPVDLPVSTIFWGGGLLCRLQQSMLVIGESDDDEEDDGEDDDHTVDISIDAGRGEWRWGGGTPLTENLTKKTMQVCVCVHVLCCVVCCI